MIPKIIHRVVPRNTTRLMDHCWQSVLKNTPDFIHYTHYDDEEYSMVGDFLPLCEKGAFRADLIRLEALYKYGGIYLDSDIELYENLEELLNTDFFVCKEDDHFIVNGVIGSSKNNNHLINLINISKDIIGNGLLKNPYLFKYKDDDLFQMGFGPFVFHQYLIERNDVLTLDSSSFDLFFHKESTGGKYGKHWYAGSWHGE